MYPYGDETIQRTGSLQVFIGGSMLDNTAFIDATQENTADTTYDVVILGGGPAGSSAAIYTSRAGLRTLVIDKGLTAGALGITSKIANYPGIVGEISGAELLERMRKQAISFGAHYVSDRVIGVDLAGQEKMVFANQATYTTKAVIVATGSMGRGTRVKGEDELLGRGVSYCATCDAPFFRDKDVVVAGNSDEAIEEALFLTRFVRKVYFLSPAPELKAPQRLIDELENNGKVELFRGTSLQEIIGKDRVESVRFVKRGEPSRVIPVSGAFVYLQGGKPITEFLPAELNLTTAGCVPVDRDFQTAIPNVYAIGDVLCDHVKQAVISAGEGALAAIALEKNLHNRQAMTVDWAK
jgi:thioredoxin reductase (NADPH)